MLEQYGLVLSIEITPDESYVLQYISELVIDLRANLCYQRTCYALIRFEDNASVDAAANVLDGTDIGSILYGQMPFTTCPQFFIIGGNIVSAYAADAQ